LFKPFFDGGGWTVELPDKKTAHLVGWAAEGAMGVR